MLVRWLVSFGASCYIIAAVAALPIWMSGWLVAPAAWWAVYLIAESIALGGLIMAALWWFLWRAAAGEKRYRPSRLAGLTALALLPLFGFLVIPVGCWVSIRSQAGVIAGWSVFAASTIALVAFWAYSRYARR